MNEGAVRRAIQGATRQAFAMGMQAVKSPASEREVHKQKAVTYAEELVLPIVEQVVQQALEEEWIRERANAAPLATAAHS